MASNAPAQCCTLGVKHEGEPTGTSTKIGGSIDAYVAEPTGKNLHKNVAILYLPDVIGIWQNSQLMADQFAANGYYTLMPDLFNGDPIKLNRPADFDFMAWLTKGTEGNNPHTYEQVDPIIEASIKHLQDAGYTSIGAVGYCFGAKYVVRYMNGKGGNGIDAGFVAHPSFVEEAELEAMTGPLSIAAAETDSIFPAEKRHKSEEILIAGKKTYQINLFSGVVHGFAVRCDLNVKVEKFAKEQAFLQAVAWFDEHLL
jgi:dienelactone hydrolase